MDYFSVDVGQAEVAALVPVGKPFMVHAKAVQDGGVEVVNVHLVPLRKIAKVIGRTVNDARPDAAAGHPDGEAVRVVVATVSGAGALRHWRSAKLAAPDHQCLVEQAALFQVGDQRRDRAVHRAAALGVLLGDLAVRIPALLVKLHKPHAALAQPPRQQAVVGEGHPGRLGPVGLAYCLRLSRDVRQLRHGGLHPIRQLVLLDAGEDCRIVHQLVPSTVQRAQQVDLVAAGLTADPIRILEVQHRVALSPQRHALMFRWQKARAPIAI